jgi:histidyl-tRNA synthetase
MAALTNGNIGKRGKFVDAIKSFIAELESLEWKTENRPHIDQETKTEDARLPLLREIPQLQHHLELARACRSQESLEESLPKVTEGMNPTFNPKLARGLREYDRWH